MPAQLPDKPVLIFDGDCGICREWVEYWQALTGGGFESRTWQDAARNHPQIPVEEFQRAIQLIQPDGRVSSGAEATFRLYGGIAPYSLLILLYRRLPGFSQLSESAYTFFSRHRGLLAAITHLFWGRNFQPVQFRATSWLFLRLLALIYLGAFISFGVQADGLIGSDGILPLKYYLEAITKQVGNDAWHLAPNLFWFNSGDTAIRAAWIAGCACAVMLLSGLLPRIALACLFVLYLSVFYAGQTFMSFQWDLLLLEAGFLAIFLPGGSRIVPWLYRWLTFRFMFMGGMVKLLGRDPTWDNLTALTYHFETQPLPTPAAWYAHHLPDSVLAGGAAATFFVELLVPFLIFAPRRLRMLAAWLFILFEFCIILTGNYNFFNLLTICICLFLFDDAALASVLPARLRSRVQAMDARRPRRAATVVAGILALLLVYTSLELMDRMLLGRGDRAASAITRAIYPCHCVNTYGPFAIMTTQRNEIVIEGSADGENWKEYPFRYKPGDVSSITGWIIPHQPRIDWQMWFAALSNARREAWFRNLVGRLLLDSPPVEALLAGNPFPDRPPLAIRALLYHYRFTTPEERKESGNWWHRELLGEYHPAVQLSPLPEKQ